MSVLSVRRVDKERVRKLSSTSAISRSTIFPSRDSVRLPLHVAATSSRPIASFSFSVSFSFIISVSISLIIEVAESCGTEGGRGRGRGKGRGRGSEFLARSRMAPHIADRQFKGFSLLSPEHILMNTYK